MPTTTWSAKRERQYAHIKTSLLESGKPEPLAEEIAARVVNKERAQHGESVGPAPLRSTTCRPADAAACVRTRGRVAAPCCNCATRPASAA